MIKLIKLEMKKCKIKGYIKGAVIANLIILAVLVVTNYSSKYEIEPAMENYTMAFSIIDAIVRATFIIFASVLISRLIIDEYKNKTITVLFMYPINRKKLIIAKLIIIVIFTFISIIISNVFLEFSFCFFDKIFHFISDKLTFDTILKNGVTIVIYAFTASCMSLIPLYFGMRKKSVSATITSSIMIIFIVCSNNGEFSLNSIITIPLSLAAIGVLIGYLSIKNIEHVDVSN